ncbi:hypothetical protein N9W79_01050, partial [bacterium]|nr:hypothetical protein [bacterium]
MAENYPDFVHIIDSDDAMSATLIEYLESIGSICRVFKTTEEAIASLEKYDDCELIVLSWNNSNINALSVFEAIRSNKNYAFVPMLVASGFLASQDFNPIDEFPCIRYVQKPYFDVDLKVNIAAVIEEASWYEEQEGFLSKLLTDVTKNEGNKANEYIEVLKKAPKSQPLIKSAARSMYDQGHKEGAKKLLGDGLSRFKGDPLLLGELARLEFLDGNFARAKEFMGVSLEMVPR